MKVSIIGIGSVGSAVATAVQNTGLAREMVLIDRDVARAQAAAEDLGHAAAFCWDIDIRATSNYRDIRGSDVVIIAAGANQKPGETRTDLLHKNVTVIRDIIPRVMAHVNPDRVKILIVTNPLDVMVMLAVRLSNLAPERVIGTGTMLDSARLRTILSRTLGASTQSINAYVLGEHGDSSVVNWTSATIGAIGLDDFCRQTKNPLNASARRMIEYRVRTAAYEIIQGRGATWDGIGAAVADCLKCIARDERRVLTVSSVVGNGVSAVALSMPTIVGANGVVAVLEPKMSAAEEKDLCRSADIIRANFAAIK